MKVFNFFNNLFLIKDFLLKVKQEYHFIMLLNSGLTKLLEFFHYFK